MKRLLLSLVLLLTLGLASPSLPSSLPPFPNPAPSITTLQLDDGRCTAFSINQDKGLFLTAYHCLEPYMQIQGEVAEVKAANPPADLAIVKAPVYLRALDLGEPPDQDAPVTMYGIHEDLPFPLIIPAQIRGVHEGEEGDPTTLRFVFRGGNHVLPGMSGGPILDGKGKVVSVVLCYYENGNSCGAFYNPLSQAYEIAKGLK